MNFREKFSKFLIFFFSHFSLFHDNQSRRGYLKEIGQKYTTIFIRNYFRILYHSSSKNTRTHTRNFIVSSYVPSSITSQLSKRFQESLSNSILPKTSLNLDPFLESCYSNCQPSNSRIKGEGEEGKKKRENSRERRKNKNTIAWLNEKIKCFSSLNRIEKMHFNNSIPSLIHVHDKYSIPIPNYSTQTISQQE